MLGVTQRCISIPSKGGAKILLVNSCYRNRDKLRPDGPLGWHASFTYTQVKNHMQNDTIIKHDMNLRKRENFRKERSRASVLFIVLANNWSILWEYNACCLCCLKEIKAKKHGFLCQPSKQVKLHLLQCFPCSLYPVRTHHFSQSQLRFQVLLSSRSIAARGRAGEWETLGTSHATPARNPNSIC